MQKLAEKLDAFTLGKFFCFGGSTKSLLLKNGLLEAESWLCWNLRFKILGLTGPPIAEA